MWVKRGNGKPGEHFSGIIPFRINHGGVSADPGHSRNETREPGLRRAGEGSADVFPINLKAASMESMILEDEPGFLFGRQGVENKREVQIFIAAV